jgi:hypothetical protein
LLQSSVLSAQLPHCGLPAAYRWLDRLTGIAGRLGWSGHTLDPGALEEAAARQTGLDDFGPPAYREGLCALTSSLERQADLHDLGRVHFHRLIVECLVSRLRLVAARRADPGLDVAPLRPPLIVCGLPRSGTTFLHRLLALAADARPLALGELLQPLPGPGPDRRLADARKRVSRLQQLVSVSIDAQHYVRPELPDECTYLFRPSFASLLLWQAPAYEWFEWFTSCDMAQPYRDYRLLLSVLCPDPQKRLVLKDPAHARNLPELFAVLPEAMVVQLHRDPVEAVPSLHKLTLTMQSVLSRRVDVPRLAEANTRWVAAVLDRSLASRAQLPAGRLLDVSYRDLIADPLAVARRIHDHFGLPWTATRAQTQAFEAQHRQRRFGENSYSPEAFGQTRAGLAARFAGYRERFLSPARSPGGGP